MLFEDKPDVIEVHGQPVWMQNELWQTLVSAMSNGKVVADVVFSRPERRRLRKRKQVLPSVWSEKHRVVIKSVLPGAWKNSVTPYLVGIMDAGARPFVREVITCRITSYNVCYTKLLRVRRGASFGSDFF